MRQPSLLRRYILFFCGVLCAALGIALFRSFAKKFLLF